PRGGHSATAWHNGRPEQVLPALLLASMRRGHSAKMPICQGSQAGGPNDLPVLKSPPPPQFHQECLEILLRALLAMKAHTVVQGSLATAALPGHDVIGFGLADPLGGELFHRGPCLWSQF